MLYSVFLPPMVFCPIHTEKPFSANPSIQIQSDDEDIEEFEYEDFPEMPEFLRRASSQQHEGYKPLGRKRVCESFLINNHYIIITYG